MALALTVLSPAAHAQEGNPIVVPPPSAPSPNVTVHNEITVEAPPPDPQAIADASVESSQAILTTVIAPPPIAWANDFLGLPDVWRTTPPNLTYDHPAIRELAGVLLSAALGLLGLAIFAQGAGYALGQDASFGRVAFAVVAALGNLAWWQIGISLNNAICQALAAPDLPTMLRPHLGAVDPASAVGTVVLTLLYAVVALMLLFSLLFRLGVLDVLIAVGSLALVCYATPQTEHLATHYTRLSIGVLFSQVLICLGLRVASVLAELGPGGGAVGTLLSIVVLWLVRSLPGMLIAGGVAGSGQNGGFLGRALGRFVLRRIGR